MVLIATIRPERSPMYPSDFARRAEVRPLTWDSDFFGAPMASLNLSPADGMLQLGDLPTLADALAHELRGAIREAELDGIQHLSLRLAASDAAAIWAAERAGLRLMDIAVDLKHALSALPEVPTEVRLATVADIPAMREMTRGAFGLTRYALDPFFSLDEVDAFYATWATNLFSGLADAVFVLDIDGAPAGFVSAKLNADGTGRIPLVATAREHQRKGVGRALIAAALQWFADKGASAAFVKTQSANYPAVALYERAGFVSHQSELTFTTTLNQE